MAKEMISVTEITSYLFCPRKLWLAKTKGIREPPTREMALGRIKHKALELFTLAEKNFVTSLSQPLEKNEIENAYRQLMRACAIQAFQLNVDIAEEFDLILTTFLAEFIPTTESEIKVRVSPLYEGLKKFKREELWENLKPKYRTELYIESPILGLKGRVDRVEFSDSIMFSDKIIPYEIKTRAKQDIYESDKVQLAAYTLLLEDRLKKKIPIGIIELRNSKKEVEITEKLKSQVLELAEKVRNLKGEFPSSFSKCQNCRLKKECEEAE